MKIPDNACYKNSRFIFVKYESCVTYENTHIVYIFNDGVCVVKLHVIMKI